MKFNLEIESVEAEVKENVLVIYSKEILRVLSSAVLNGGLKEANGIINVQVPENCGQDKNDIHWNAQDFLKEQVQKLQLPSDKIVGLMTAAKMKNVATATRKYDETTVTVFVTAGTTVAVTAGEPTASRKSSVEQKCGTINIVVLVDGNLTENSMVEAHKTITEAKTVALRELDVRSQLSGDIATGTLTDSIAVACTGKGDTISFAGTFTMIGELIGYCVRECVKEAIYMQEQIAANRPLQRRLAERRIQTEHIASLLTEPSIPVESPIYQRLKKEVEQMLADRKIASLVLTSLRYDDDLRKDLIPVSSNDSVETGAFEEIVQVAVRNYLDNNKSLCNNARIKQKSEDEIEVGPLTACVFKAISENAYSRICEADDP
jgi:adenosylcobinamide amidohydrolase